MKKSTLIISVLISLLSWSQSTNAQWQQTNGPYGGDIYDMAVSGTNIFVATESGVFLSTDSGASWANKGLRLVSILAVCETKIFAYSFDGFFQSSDNGTTWALVSNFPPLAGISSIAVNGTNMFVVANEGIYLSNDSGINWNNVGNNFPVFDEFGPIAISGTNLFVVNDDSLYLSTNNGASWKLIDNGLTSDSLIPMVITSITVNGANIFLVTGFQGVFLSADTGATWTPVTNSLPSFGYTYFLRAIGANIFAVTDSGLYISTNNALTWTQLNSYSLFSAYNPFPITSMGSTIWGSNLGYGVCKSVNNGTSWTDANNGLTANPISSFAVSGTNIFAVNDVSELFLSTNNGSNWTNISSGLGGMNVYSIVSAGTYIYIGTGEGLFLSTNNGTSWSMVDNISDIIISVATGGSNIIAASENNGIYVSNDNGANWNATSNGLPTGFIEDSGFDPIYSTAIFGNTFFVGSLDSGVYMSTNYGVSWAPVNNGLLLDTEGGIFFYDPVSSFAAIGTNIFAGGGEGVFLSSNNGASWTPVNNDIGYYYFFVNSLISSGNNIFAATDAGTGGVFVSSDSGAKWVQINKGLTDQSVLSCAVNGTNMFIGTDATGVWTRSLSDIVPECAAIFTLEPDTVVLHHYMAYNYSFGEGTVKYDWSWGDSSPDDTIPYPTHTYAAPGFYNICLSISDSGGCTSTFCDTSFYLDRTTNTMISLSVVNPLTVGIQEATASPSQLIIYPNPARNKLSIKDNGVHIEKATIYNTLGQLYYQAMITSLQPEIDISNLPAGVYFLQLRSESGSVAKMFVKE